MLFSLGYRLLDPVLKGVVVWNKRSVVFSCTTVRILYVLIFTPLSLSSLRRLGKLRRTASPADRSGGAQALADSER